MIGQTNALAGILAGILISVATNSEAQSYDTSTVQFGSRLSQGDRLMVIDTDHRVSSGVFHRVSGSSLRMLEDGVFKDIAVEQIAEVRKRGDSPWNGFLIGAALGAAIGFGTFEECQPVPPAAVCGGNLTTNRGMETAVAAALFGSIGLTVDLLTQRSTTVYRATEPPAKRRVSVRVTATTSEVGGRLAVRF